jgi:hypothetical protein
MQIGDSKEYVGLFCAEMPEARFFDVYTLVNTAEESRVVCHLDRRFLDVCVPGSIVPIAVAPNRPCQAGIWIQDGRAWIDLSECPHGVPTRLVVTVSGVRRGKQGDRFPAFTVEAARQNRAFWEQAYKPPGR